MVTPPSSPPRIRPETPPATLDPNAIAESHLMAQGRLSKHKREETVRTHIHWATLLVFWTFVMALFTISGVWLYHLVTPTRAHFLDADQLGTLETVLLTAVGSSFITNHSRRWLSTYDRDSRG